MIYNAQHLQNTDKTMALRTQYIENRDYSAQETCDIIMTHNIFNSQTLSLSILLAVITSSIKLGILTNIPLMLNDMISSMKIKDSLPDTKYSGVEITNFLNEFGKLSMIRPGYTEKKLDLVKKLFNHEYNTKDVLTYDQIGYTNWPAAVLMSNKEDVEKQFIQNPNDMPLVSDLDTTSDVL